MNVRLDDPESLALLEPRRIAAYLTSRGWVRTRTMRQGVGLWESLDNVCLHVPESTVFADYGESVGAVINSISSQENRSSLSLFTDIANINADVVRLRLPLLAAHARGPTLGAGVEIYEGLRDLFIAVGCGLVDAKPYYPRRKPPEVVEALKHVNLGFPELSSYVITVLVGLPEQFVDEPVMLDFEPFGRQVALRTIEATKQAIRFATLARDKNDIEVYRESLMYGVNANLCDSLVRIIQSGSADGVQQFALDVQCSPLIPRVGNPVEERVAVDSRYVDILDEASKFLKQEMPIDDAEVIGHVIRLSRRETDDLGHVSVAARLDRGERVVKMVLDRDRYQHAVRAHETESIFRAVGTLEFLPGGVELHNVQDVSIFTKED